MNKPLLSICIPTYSRERYLKECLDSIVAQFGDQEVRDNVEVVVSDNASPDNTREVVEEYRQKFSNIKYFRNDKNIGFDLNVINVVEKANGEYCWYMGDDDCISGNSLRFLTKFLKKNKVVILTVDIKIFTDLESAISTSEDIQESSVSIFDSHENFLQKGRCVGILSAFIFNRDSWLLFANKSKFYDGWLYYEVILKMMPKVEQSFAYINYPVVLAKQYSEWVEGGKELYMFIGWKRLLATLPDFGHNKEMVRKELGEFPRRLIIMLLRAKGHDLCCSTKDLKLIWSEFYKSPFYLLVATIIFFVPNRAVKFIRDARKKLYAKK